jgi:two-component sensor histidine kinase
LGLQLVDTLIEQIDGSLKLERNNGTKFIIKFKI